MVDALSIAVSGLNAQKQRLAASANNIANVSTGGALPTAGGPASTVYKPLSVSYTALTAGNGAGAGVKATVTEDANGFTPVYDPSSAFANEGGIVAVPNVSLEREAVNILESKSLYKANLAVIKTQNQMLDALLDIVT